MAFSGAPVVQLVTDTCVRISGAELDAGEDGVIGLSDATGAPPDLLLPGHFDPRPYVIPDDPVGLQPMVTVMVQPAGGGPLVAVPIVVTKTGTTDANFRITLTNVAGGSSNPAPGEGNSSQDFSDGGD